MGDLFDDPDVAGALAHCSSEWGTGLSFGGDGADEEASFFDVTVALPPALAFSGGAPHACPRTPPGPPLYARCAGAEPRPELRALPSAPPIPPLPGGPGERAAAPAEHSTTPRHAEQHAAAPSTPADARLQLAEGAQRQSTPSRSAKRRRGSSGSDERLDSALERLRHEYQELLSENRSLQEKCAAAQAQVEGAQRTAAKERQTLAVLIGALMPHKASLALVPQESVASTLSRFGSCGLPPEQEHSGSAGTLPQAQAGGSQGGAQGSDKALAETVAAAALAINKARPPRMQTKSTGNPAGALLDLLSLVVRGGAAPAHALSSLL